VTSITRRQLLGLFSTIAVTGRVSFAQNGAAIHVYKDATCGCCSIWVEHLRKAGFKAAVTDADDMMAIKAKHGVPQRVRSCHTGLVDGFVVEGHVPAADIQRMLKERPAIAGIGVPGMPIGSPGMEVAGVKPQAYDVLAFNKAGETHIFASHR
jgi:hypothetical protein